MYIFSDVTDIDCGAVISEVFSTNEVAKVYKFTSTGEEVYFDGCDSEFDTIFTVLTEEQYLAGNLDEYTLRRDDAFTICGGFFSRGSYITLPSRILDRYQGDYYLVVTAYDNYVSTDSQLNIVYNCADGRDDYDHSYTWEWEYYMYVMAIDYEELMYWDWPEDCGKKGFDCECIWEKYDKDDVYDSAPELTYGSL